MNAASKYLRGARDTKRQIVDYAEVWQRRARRSIEAAGPDQPAVVVLGDSLCQGIGASRPDAGHIGALFDESVPVINLSRSGSKISDVVDVQLPAAASLAALGVPVGLTICTVGSNDLVMQWRTRSVANALVSLATSLPPGSVMSTLPSGGSLVVKSVNRRFQRLVADIGHDIAPVDAHYRGFGITAKDHFHPNDAGYVKFADAFRSVETIERFVAAQSVPTNQMVESAGMADAPASSSSLAKTT